MDRLFKLIYPTKCAICGVNIEIKATQMQEFTCNNCKLKLEYIRDDYVVKKAYGKYFDYICSPYFYEKEIRNLILGFKFSNKKYLCDFLSLELINILSKFKPYKIDYVIYVPISLKRCFERGYNQSYLLAKRISQRLDIPIAKYGLIKIKNNKTQSNLNVAQRLTNPKGAYKVLLKSVLKDKIVLLVDDIYTTGSTLNECSKVLKEAGVKTIIAVTSAKARYGFDTYVRWGGSLKSGWISWKHFRLH